MLPTETFLKINGLSYIIGIFYLLFTFRVSERNIRIIKGALKEAGESLNGQRFLNSKANCRSSTHDITQFSQQTIMKRMGRQVNCVSSCYWKCNFPMTRCVRRQFVRRSVIISWKDGKWHFHAPIGSLVIFVGSDTGDDAALKEWMDRAERVDKRSGY